MKIHFSLIHNADGYRPNIVTIAHLRTYIRNKNLNLKVSYNHFRYDYVRSKDNIDNRGEYINRIQHGLESVEFMDLNNVITLLNNYRKGRNLLHDIPLTPNNLKVINQIDSYYSKNSFDVVAFSCFRPYIFYNFYALLLLKRKNPNIKIVMGGMQVINSHRFAELCARIPEIDYVISGDIETAIEDLYNNKVQRGIVHYSKDVDMELIQPPTYHDIEIKMLDNTLMLTTIRGCPNRCSFCVSNVFNFRKSSIDSIKETFKYYNKYNNIKRVYLNDNTVNYSKKRMHDFSDALIDVGNKFDVNLYLVFKNLDKDIIQKMQTAKLNNIKLGIEGLSESQRIDMNVDHKCKNMEDMLDILTQDPLNKISMTSVVAFPTETELDFKQSTDYIQRLLIKYQNKFDLYMFPYLHSPGTHVYDNPENYGIFYSYWDKQPISEELNAVITTIPRFYTCDINQKDYIKRVDKCRKLMYN